MGDSANDLTRGQLLRKAGLLGVGVVATGGMRGVAHAHAASLPFHGTHQAGIATPQQEHAYLTAFDLAATALGDLRDLLRSWSGVAADLCAGRPAGNPGAPGYDASLPPSDTGEAVDLGPAGLTVTFGLGPALFDAGRLGLAAWHPAPLAPVLALPGDQLEQDHSGGDLLVQACADNPQVAFHAVRMLTRAARGVATPRWMQRGFLPVRDSAGTPRNLLGFKDGTNNLRGADLAAMRDHVWAGSTDPPAWMRGGTYMVVRRIRVYLEAWDHDQLGDQEQTIGRAKASGAPLGGRAESTPLDLRATDAQGHPAIPLNAHVRLAHQGPERILRRGYSFADGLDLTTGGLNAGLLFICFQRDPRRQFVPLQRRLGQHDALNEYIAHVGSAIFACPPGAEPGGYVGKTLLG